MYLGQYLGDVWLKMNSVIEDYKYYFFNKISSFEIKLFFFKINSFLIFRGFQKKIRNLKDLSEENLDILYYINDIFMLAKPKLNNCIANALILSCLNPILVSSFTDSKKGMLSLKLALYLIPLILKTLTHDPLKEWLILKLFSSKILKNEVYLKVATNNFSTQALKEALGLDPRCKSPLENAGILKEIIINDPKNEKNEGILIENSTREIILSYLKKRRVF